MSSGDVEKARDKTTQTTTDVDPANALEIETVGLVVFVVFEAAKKEPILGEITFGSRTSDVDV